MRHQTSFCLILLLITFQGLQVQCRISGDTSSTKLRKRRLQGGVEIEDGVYKFCGVDYNPGRPNNHVLTNVNRVGEARLNWLNAEGEEFCVIYNSNDHTLTIHGVVVPNRNDVPVAPLTIWAQFSNLQSAEDCYCANEVFAQDLNIRGFSFANPNYRAIQDLCTIQNYLVRSAGAASQLFCPKCENNECKKANDRRQSNGAPFPIYKDWDLFVEVTGELKGDGLPILREQILRLFPELNASITTCTLDVTNLPLPQFFCTDLEDPESGFGYGVNGKNQKCGFACWLNCKEDIEALAGSGDLLLHTMDINIDIEKCPCEDNGCTENDGICTTEHECDSIGGEFNPGLCGDDDNDRNCGCCISTDTPTTTPTVMPTVRTDTPTTTPTATPTGCEQTPECTVQDGSCVSQNECSSTGREVFIPGLCNEDGNDNPNCGCCVPIRTDTPTTSPTSTPTSTPTFTCEQDDEVCLDGSGICKTPEQCNQPGEVFDQRFCSNPNDPSCGCCFPDTAECVVETPCEESGGKCLDLNDCSEEKGQEFEPALCSNDPRCGCCICRPQSLLCAGFGGICASSASQCGENEEFDQTLCGDANDPTCGCCKPTTCCCFEDKTDEQCEDMGGTEVYEDDIMPVN